MIFQMMIVMVRKEFSLLISSLNNFFFFILSFLLSGVPLTLDLNLLRLKFESLEGFQQLLRDEPCFIGNHFLSPLRHSEPNKRIGGSSPKPVGVFPHWYSYSSGDNGDWLQHAHPNSCWFCPYKDICWNCRRLLNPNFRRTIMELIQAHAAKIVIPF